MSPSHRFSVILNLFLAVFGLSLGCESDLKSDDSTSVAVPIQEIRPIRPEVRFAGVLDMVFVDGALWILDTAPPLLTKLPLDGGQTVRIGSEGRGPGEFLEPHALQASPDQKSRSLLVWDFGLSRVSEISEDGHILRSERLSEEGRLRARSDIRDVSFVDPFRVRRLGTGFLVAHSDREIHRTSDAVSSHLQVTDRVLTPMEELVWFPDLIGEKDSGLTEWVQVPLWDVCEDQVALWNPNSSSIQWLDGKGRLVAGTTLPIAPTRITLQDVERYLRWMARLELGPDFRTAGIDFPSMARAYRDHFARFRPIGTELRCAGRNTAWIRLFDTTFDPLGRGSEWIVATPGRVGFSVRFPPEFTPFLFSVETVIGATETTGGFQVLGSWSTDSLISTLSIRPDSVP